MEYARQRNSRETTESHMLISNTLLRQILGVLWLIDGLLQLQPQMFTMNMVNGVMQPAAQGQPAPIAASLDWIIALTTHNLVLFNWLIAILQIALGVLIFLGKWVRPTLIVSIIWAIIVWYAGEGMSLLLTGQASVLTGAPGSVLFYALLAVVLLPRSNHTHATDGKDTSFRGLLSRYQLQLVLGGFWVFAALLQLQPYWWQNGQISQQVSSLYTSGTLSHIILDPSLHLLSSLSANSEVELNIVLIGVFLLLGAGLFVARGRNVRPWLVATIIVSLILWWFNQALGMTLTGMATDPNSGPLVILVALACWPLLTSHQHLNKREDEAQPTLSQEPSDVSPVRK